MAYNLLKGKKGIIFGALDSNSIAWKTAEKAYDEGARFTLSNTPTAIRFGQLNELAEKCNAEVIPADATNVDDLMNVFERSMEILGGKVDFVLHSIGMSLNVRKKRVYNDLNYNFLQKTLDISAISFHKMLQVAYKLDAINEWGSVVALSYIAAQRVLYGNTISQSPTKTTAGSGVKGFDGLIDFTHRMSPLGNADAEECANYCVVMFSDLGGFSSMGMSLKAMAMYNKSLGIDLGIELPEELE